jgi:hypothetical protein
MPIPIQAPKQLTTPEFMDGVNKDVEWKAISIGQHGLPLSIRQHGTLLLPKIRLQDQVIDPRKYYTRAHKVLRGSEADRMLDISANSKTGATICFNPTTLTMAPRSSRIVALHFTRPSGLDESRIPIYSGYVAINSSNGDPFPLIYAGVASCLKDATIMNTAAGFLLKFKFYAPLQQLCLRSP